MKRSNDISACIYGALETYFADLDGEMPAPIYDIGNQKRRAPDARSDPAAGGRESDSGGDDARHQPQYTLRKKLVDYKLV